MSNPVRVTAIVEAFSAKGGHEQYESGVGMTRAATTLRIEDPDVLRGRRLVLSHTRPPAEDSAWRKPQARLRFLIDRELLDSNDTLFVGAVWDVTSID